jgi:hypothetical protein
LKTKIINEQFYKKITRRKALSLSLICWSSRIKTEWETLYFSRLNKRLYYRKNRPVFIWPIGFKGRAQTNRIMKLKKRYDKEGGSWFEDFRKSRLCRLPNQISFPKNCSVQNGSRYKQCAMEQVPPTSII